jgi:hypothetical protein
MMVDLPAPFGPSNPKISPFLTAKETSSIATKSLKSLRRWEISMALPFMVRGSVLSGMVTLPFVLHSVQVTMRWSPGLPLYSPMVLQLGHLN